MQGTPLLPSISRKILHENVTVLCVDNLHAHAEISLFGGQVLSFQPHRDGRERLFLSALARLDGSKSIRGGIPVCWPWFGAHPQDNSLPAHGYVRTRQWTLQDAFESVESTTLVLQASSTDGPGFDGSAALELHITIGSSLRLELFTRNTGTQPFPLSCALHSYFAVTDTRHTQLDGLTGTYSDKTRNWALFDTPTPYGFSEETDRIHLQACRELRIVEEHSSTTIQSLGHDSIVVWNPWDTCAQKFPDMEAVDYTRMLCVETALTQGYQLAPGCTHLLVQVVK